MKELQDLANLVIVRNQLVLLMGSRSGLAQMGVSQSDYRNLDSIRAAMDKALLDGCLELNLTESKKGNELTITGGDVTGSNTVAPKEITISAEKITFKSPSGNKPEITIASGNVESKQLSLPLDQPKKRGRKPKSESEMTQDEKDRAEIAKRVAEAKANLPKNSFKRSE
jgi:hypothetical protein